MDTQVLTWTAHGLTEDAPDGVDPVLVADSWLVEDGRARALERHRQRFTDGCADAGVPERVVAPFWHAAMAVLPETGELFPRVELSGAPARRRVRVRPSPTRGREVRVWVPEVPDPRAEPLRKGPDLGTLGELRGAAQTAGADDAVLLSREGVVLESGTAGLVWWDKDRLCVPAADLPVLPSVTVSLIRDEAARRGVAVDERHARLDDLDGRETWLVNALHGIRPVTAWRGAGVAPGPAYRAPKWRLWWATEVPLHRVS